MNPGDIVRVHLRIEGRPCFEWEDEIESADSLGWCMLKKAKIRIEIRYITLIGAPIPEGTIVEMWNGGPEYDGGAHMGWYVSYDKVQGKHWVSSIKNKIEGRALWDNVRVVGEGIANNPITMV